MLRAVQQRRPETRSLALDLSLRATRTLVPACSNSGPTLTSMPPSCVDPRCERTIEALHGVDGPFDRGRPRKLVYPSPSNRKPNAAGALVVEALPGEGSAELRLDRGTLCMEEVEKGFVVRRDRIVDVQLRASFILEHRVLALFTVGDVYASLCKRGVYAPFSAQRRSRALF